MLLRSRPSARFPSMEAAATLDPALCTSAVCASAVHVLCVLKQACTGRCSVSNVHKRPMVFGGVINLQFTVKHTAPAVRAPINQHPDVCNLALVSPCETLTWSESNKESFSPTTQCFGPQSLIKSIFKTRRESVKCSGYHGSIAALSV